VIFGNDTTPIDVAVFFAAQLLLIFFVANMVSACLTAACDSACEMTDVFRTESEADMIPIQRDLEQARVTLQQWLEVRHATWRGTEVGALQEFSDGFSGELYGLDVTYHDDHSEHTHGLVVRFEPGAQHQLFLETMFEEQYRVMEALRRHAVRVPRLFGFEPDSDVLGARFFVMERSRGRAGQLGPGWMKDIGARGRERTWWGGLAAMAELHRCSSQRLGLDFLDQPRRGSDPIDQQLRYHWEYYSWVREGESHPVVEAAYQWLRRNKPPVLPPTGLVWGDARRGNQLFTEDLHCTAILDFEMISLGPAEVDLGWWLEGEYQTAEILGFEAQPTLKETTERYAELLGREIADLGYYMVFAAFRLAVLRIKLYRLREGQPYRGKPRDGDKRLARVLADWAGITGLRV
jgi:aminoglycoside phosphotransferase (APT) family kinase protein